ncbi:hypothetical protein FRC10_007876 [Ceratobasidium sp. 414]|nr:hypothetical protein FRC10_007876 [Ceratobasidium sp. 414]
MFIPQERSVRFEDADNERNPYSIPPIQVWQHHHPPACSGHAFCHPCLNSLVSAPSCPSFCRSYTAESIQKAVCAQRESGSGPAESEEETLMWRAIGSAVETPDGYEQRKSLVKHNPLQSVRQAGMSTVRPCLFLLALCVALSQDEKSQNLLIALDVLRMLVEVEQQNHALKDKVGTARAVEESLCDRISILGAQLSAKTGETSASSHDLQLLLTQVRALQTSVQLIKSDTSTIVRHLNIESATPTQPLSPNQPRTQPQPPTQITPDPTPGDTLHASTSTESWSPLSRETSSENSNNSNSTPTPTIRTGSNPKTGRPKHVQRPPAEALVTATPISTKNAPARPLNKWQRQRLARLTASTGGAIAADGVPVQTIATPDNPGPITVAGGLGGEKARNEELPSVAAKVEDAWGFDGAGARAGDGSGGRPVGAGSGSSKGADGVGVPVAPSGAGMAKASNAEFADVATLDAALGDTTSDDTRKTNGTLDDIATTVSSPVPVAHPDTTPGSGGAPSQDAQHGTLPSTAVDGDLTPETTEPNGELPNFDNAPLVPVKTTTRAPTIDVILAVPFALAQHDSNVTSSPQVEQPHKSGAIATPRRASPAGPSLSSTPVTSGQGLASSGTVKPACASSPTSGVSDARSPGVVGFGSARSTQFGFGQQKPANFPPPPSAMPRSSWGVGAPMYTWTSSKPAAGTGGWDWGGISSFVIKAQNAIDAALADETPAPGSNGQRALPRKPTALASQPAPTLPAHEVAPASKGIDERIAALPAKQAARKAAAVLGASPKLSEDEDEAAGTGVVTPLMNKRPSLMDMHSASPSPETGGFGAYRDEMWGSGFRGRGGAAPATETPTAGTTA